MCVSVVCVVLGIEPRVLDMYSPNSATSLVTRDWFYFRGTVCYQTPRKKSAYASLLNVAEWMKALDQGQVGAPLTLGRLCSSSVKFLPECRHLKPLSYCFWSLAGNRKSPFPQTPNQIWHYKPLSTNRAHTSRKGTAELCVVPGVGTIRLEGRARDKLAQKPSLSKGCVYLLDHEIESYKINSGVHHHTPPLSHSFSSIQVTHPCPLLGIHSPLRYL